MDRLYDVVVAGCGPVGAAAANLLAARGLSVCVVEPNAEPYALPRAIHLDHEIMRILQSAGLAERIAPLLHVPAGSMVFGVDLAPIRPFRPNRAQPALGWAASYFFRQPELERAMRDALHARDAVTLLFGHAIVGVKQDDMIVTATIEGPGGAGSVRGRYLIACDGGRSAVRKQIGIELEDLGFEEPWIVVDALVDEPVTLPPLRDTPPGVDMRDVMFTIADPARPMSFIPGAGRHRRWEFMLLPGEAAEAFEQPERIAAMIAPWVPGGGWRPIRQAIYKFHALIARRWRDGRIFLAGDAAHQTPPFFGQGLCHGIRDAANLAWKLEAVLHHGADAALLDTYEPERKPQVRAVIEASVRTGRYICTLDPELAARRDRDLREPGPVPAAPPPDLIPPIGDGLLAAGDHPMIGARFIQPFVMRGGETALLDSFTGHGFVVLVRGRDAESILLPARLRASGARLIVIREATGAGDLDVVDHLGELGRWLDRAGAVGVIVRPDFYVYDVFATAEAGIASLDALAERLSTHARQAVEAGC